MSKLKFIFRPILIALCLFAPLRMARSADYVVSQVEMDGSWVKVLNLANDYIERTYGSAVSVDKSKITISDRGGFFSVQYLLPQRIQIDRQEVDEIEITVDKSPRLLIKDVVTRTLRLKNSGNQ